MTNIGKAMYLLNKKEGFEGHDVNYVLVEEDNYKNNFNDYG